MNQKTKIYIPDIGDFKNVPVIEILVKIDDFVEKEQSLITIESDKATLEIPSPKSGLVKKINVELNQKVSKGDLVLILETQETLEMHENKKSTAEKSKKELTVIETDLVVIGSGPGGYTCAFRAADLGQKVVLIEKYSKIGGVCLNVGCIPSKSLLHTAKIIDESKKASEYGLSFNSPEININALKKWKNNTIDKLTSGLNALSSKRKIKIIEGVANFTSSNTIIVTSDDDNYKTIKFKKAVIAVGSQPRKMENLPNSKKIMDSTEALNINEIPEKLLIIGGGIIGLEMAEIYSSLGSKITIVELSNQIMPEADFDIIDPLLKRIKTKYESIHLNTSVKKIEVDRDKLNVFFSTQNKSFSKTFDKVLVAIGRVPNGKNISVEKAGVQIKENGFIPVNERMQTNISHIYAIGDVVGQPMLAHKASHEAKVAAENITGKRVFFEPKAIPSVAYTNPEVAWVGITESEAKKKKIKYKISIFPWSASGRALASDSTIGKTKILYDPSNKKILGAAIVGAHAGELISELVLALEMGADTEDLSLTIHPHPTLSESILFSSEIAEKTITDMYIN